MKSDVTFGKWDPKIHKDPEQKKRQKSALDKKLTPLEIDYSEETGVFMGTKKRYVTALDSCQCIDNLRRGLPCKHIYRLAMELGLFPGLEKSRKS